MRHGSRVVWALALVAAGCGGGSGGGGSGEDVVVNSAVSTGDVAMSGTAGREDGKLTLSLSAIRDPDDAGKPADGDHVALTVTTEAAGTSSALAALLAARASGPVAAASAAAPDLACALAKVKSGAGTKADIVFINDTTASMSGTVQGIADSIASFTQAISASGVDARFAMYTYGDAFATRRASGSEFTIGQGDFTPPDIDLDERPYLGLSDLTTFQGFLAELKASSALGSGGEDDPENTVGTLDYARGHLAFRGGANKAFVAIGDNPSHQAGDGDVDSWPEAFRPATGADLVSRFAATAAIHVVGDDTGSGGSYYNLKSLADGTGGVFLPLPGDGVVDLSALHLQDWFTNALAGTCTTAPSGRYVVVIHATVTGSLGTVKTGALALDLTVK